MLTLHQFPISPFCDKIRRILHVKRVPFVVRNVSLAQSATTFRKLNSIGKVPCLEDGGVVVADSTDIARYLDEHYPTPRLLPASPRERALCHVLEDWADESLYFYEVRLRFTFARNARRTVAMLTEGEPSIVRAAAPHVLPGLMRRFTNHQGVGRKPEAMVLRDVERHVEAISGWLDGGAFLVGETLTLADISVFAQLSRIRETEEGARLVAAKPDVVAWMDRIAQATAGEPVEPAEIAAPH